MRTPAALVTLVAVALLAGCGSATATATDEPTATTSVPLERPTRIPAASREVTVELEVVHDDGSIQAWVDQEYGAGVVAVTSKLRSTS